jgi:polyphosphate kinase 2 (PPK2 family)
MKDSMKLTKSDLQKLSSTRGLIYLLKNGSPDVQSAINRLRYNTELRSLQVDLIKLQNRIVDKGERLLVIFEGGEFAGKGSAIKAFVDFLNPRSARTVALPKPTKAEEGQWYFQRYVMQLPKPGEMVFFDRSWYNRAVVEPVNGFCTNNEYQRFMSEVNHFENMLSNDGISIIKIFLQIWFILDGNITFQAHLATIKHVLGKMT